MKNLIYSGIVSLFVIFLPLFSVAQQQRETHFFSSFVVNNQAFNYEYWLTANQISSLKIEKITNNPTPDAKAIEKNLNSISEQITAKATEWGIADSLAKIQSGISNLKKVIPAGLINFKDANLMIDTLLLHLRKAIAPLSDDTINKQKIAEIEGLITSFQLLKNSNVEVVKQESEIKFSAFTPQTVKSILDNKLRDSYSINLTAVDLNDLSQKIFYEITTRINIDNDQPPTAFLRLNTTKINGYFEDVIVKKDNNNKPTEIKALPGILDPLTNNTELNFLQKQNSGKVLVTNGLIYVSETKRNVPVQIRFVNADLEFEAGTIKNIEAFFYIKIDGIEQLVKFRNNIPISITNKYTPEELGNHKIYAANAEKLPQEYLIKQHLGETLTLDKSKNEAKEFYFYLGDLIRYDVILSNYREDYSPKDIVVKLSEQQSVIELKKQERSKILTVKTYTDFNGINSEQPNGLIQVEASLGVNVVTKRWQGLTFLKSKSIYQGVITKADLTGHLSKIEENNKYLFLKMKDTVALSSTDGQKKFQINALDLLRYKNTGIDFNLNLYKLNFTKAMSNFQLNGSFGIWRTGIADSLTVTKGVYTASTTRAERMATSTAFTLNAAFEFMPEERYSFKVSASNTWVNLRSTEINLNQNKGQIRTLSFEGFLNLNQENTSRLFFRWRFNTQSSNSKINFNQVQLGYLVDIFKTSK